MRRAQLHYPLPVDSDGYFRCVFDDEYNRRYYYDVLGYRGLHCLSLRREGETLVRELAMDPAPRGVPDFLARLLGFMRFRELATYDMKTRSMHLRILTRALTRRIDIQGEMRCLDDGGGGCQLQVAVAVAVDLPFIGRLLERLLFGELTRSFDALAVTTLQFVAEKAWSGATEPLLLPPRGKQEHDREQRVVDRPDPSRS